MYPTGIKILRVMLFMFYHFRNKCKLKRGRPPSHCSKLNESGVLNVVNTNKGLVEPFSHLVDAAFVQFRADLTPNCDPFSQQENDKAEQELVDMENDQPSENDFNKENQSSQNYSERASSQL